VKTTICAISLLSAAAAISLLQAETAYTDPVMAQSKSLPTGYSVVSINALNSIEASGVIDGLSVDGETTILEVSSVPDDWSTNSFADPGNLAQFNFRNVPLYYVEITSAPEGGTSKVGQILDVLATATGDPATLTVGGDLSSIESSLVDQTFVIRKKRTLEDVFGRYNDVGLLGGLNPDEVDIIYNLYDGDFERVFMLSSGGVDYGWRIVGELGTEVNDMCIDPDFGLMIYRRGTNDVELVTVGDVKLNTARTTITPGYNALTMKFPVGITLEESELYKSNGTGILGGINQDEVDLVYILSDGGAFLRYFYLTAGGVDYGWRQVGELGTDVSDLPIPAGSMIIVYRRGTTSVEWSLEQPFVLNN